MHRAAPRMVTRADSVSSPLVSLEFLGQPVCTVHSGTRQVWPVCAHVSALVPGGAELIPAALAWSPPDPLLPCCPVPPSLVLLHEPEAGRLHSGRLGS